MKKIQHIKGQKGIKLKNQLRNIPYNKILVVAIDPAKYSPKALICNYFGEILVNSFFFQINSNGLNSLLEKVQNTANSIDAQKVLIGIETTSHYHEVIVRFLESCSYDVILINAYTTSEIRTENLNWCKTDDIDLYAIASAITENKITETKLPKGIYSKLRSITRSRRYEVRERSKLKSKIRNLIDVIWPNYQGKGTIVNGRSCVDRIFSDFWSKASIFIMSNYPHPSHLLTLSKKDLRSLSKKHNLKLRNSTIDKLLQAAKTAITQPYEDFRVKLKMLELRLKDLENANTRIDIFNNEIEELLVQTPGILLLSIPEIGLATAAEFTAEMGPIKQYRYAGQLIKRAGTNPTVTESGGKEYIYGSISKQGNPSFRNAIYLIGHSLATGNTNPYFRQFADRLREKGKKSGQVYIATGNKFIKIAFAMLRDRKLFNPPLWKGEQLTCNIFDKFINPEHKSLAVKTLNEQLNISLEKLAG